MAQQIPSLHDLPSYTDTMTNWRTMAIDSNRKIFEPYKNIYAGKSIIIYGSGPSARFFKPNENTICIGANSAILDSVVQLNYLFALDYMPYVELANELGGAVKKFFGRSITWPLMTIGENAIAGFATGFYTNFSERLAEQYHFTNDIALNFLKIPKSTIFAMMLFALHTGPSRIFLIGCDCCASRLDKEGRISSFSRNSDLLPMLEGWKAMKDMALRYYPQIEIISVNPRGLRGIFRDDYQNAYAVSALNWKDYGEYEKALKRAERAIKLDPANLGLMALRAELLTKVGQTDEAIKSLREGIAGHPDWSEGCKLLGRILVETGNEIECLQLFNAFINSSACNADLGVDFALALLKFGHVDIVKKIMAQASKGFRMLFAYRIFQKAEWNPNKGEQIAILREAISWSNEMPQLNYYLCMNMRAVGEVDSMLAVADEAAARFPEFEAVAHRLKAWVALDRGNLDDAMLHAREMWRLNLVWDCTPQMMLQVLIARGKYSEALSLSLEIEEATPGLDYTPYYLSRIYEELGDMDKALEYAEKSITAYPIIREFYRFAYVSQYISMLHVHGELDKAENFLLAMIERHLNQADLLRQLSSVRSWKGDREGALAAAREALACDPANTSLTRFLADTLARYGQTDEALEIIEARLQFTPGWSMGWRKKAELLRACADREVDNEMLESARKAHETDPESLVMLNFYTNISKSLSDIDTFEEYEKGVAANPGWGNGWVQLYGYFNDLGELDKALYFAHEAVENAPEYIWSWVALIAILIRTEDIELAEEVGREFMEAFPESGLPLRQMARICEAKGNDGQALLWMRKACQKSPRDVTSLWNVYISMLHSKKMYQAEKTALRQALKVNPFWLTGWQKLVDLSSPIKDKIYFLQQATTFNPSWANGWLQLANSTGIPAEKENYLDKATRLTPHKIQLWTALLNVMSDPEKQKEAYKEALKHHPHWSNGYYKLSLLYS